MRIWIVLVALLLAVEGESARCKIKTLKTGERETKLDVLVRKTAKGMQYAFGSDADGRYLRVVYARHFTKKMSIDDETPLTLTLDDGAEIQLPPIIPAKSRHQGSVVLGSKLLRLRYALTDEQLTTLTKRQVREVRFAFKEKKRGPGVDAHDINDKRGIEFRDAALCFAADPGG